MKSTLRQRQTEPGLVAFYDIQPGNGAGQFLQPRSSHGDQHPQWRHIQDTVLTVMICCWYGII